MGLPTLPYIDLLNFKGLFTKSSPDILQAEQLRIAENCDLFETYGALTKVKGNTRILSTQYAENGVIQKIPWIDFYKTSDLDGQILRHTLVAAGTILGRIDGSSITTLKTGRTADLFHSSDQHEKFTYITNQNPDLVGQGDDLVKYDGAVITNWGLTAPGGTQTVRESFNTSSTFQTKPASQMTVTDDSTITWDGASTRIDKDVAGSRLFYIEKKLDNQFYASSDARPSQYTAANRVSFFTYIPRGQLTADSIDPSSFNTGEAAMAVWVSPDGDTVENNHWKFYFAIGELVEGWNKLNLDFSGAPVGPKGHFYPEDQTIKRVRWDFRLNDETHTRTGIRLDRFHSLDEGNPIATVSGVGTQTGVYQYVVTYVSKYGQESNAGPASAAVTAASHAQIDLTNIPVSEDLQVTARQIYRTVAGGSLFLFLDRIENNSATTYTDIIPDGSLGTSTPPQVGDFSDDNSPPPKVGIFKVWKDTGFMAGDPQNPNSLYYSEVNELESWPLLNEFQLDDKITAIYETYSTLIVETETGKWQVMGDNPDFAVDKLVDNMGCVGRRAAGKSRMVGYAVDKDGLRLFDGNNTEKISEPIRDKYDALPKKNIDLMHTTHSKRRNVILQFNPDTTSPIPEYDSIFSYQYSIDDVTKGYWTTLNIPSDINILDTVEIEDTNSDFHLYASDDSGMVYEFFTEGQLNWTGPTGSSTPIKTKFQTPYLRLGGPLGQEGGFSGRVQPRYIEIRVENNTAINWTVTVESAEGSSQVQALDSQDVVMTFGTNNSLIRQSLKPNFHPGEFVRITVENNEADVDCRITGIRIAAQLHPFPGQVINVKSVT